MLVEYYIVLSVVAWLLVVLAYVFRTKGTRIVLQILALILFAGLAYGSTDVERVVCVDGVMNETSAGFFDVDFGCEKRSDFDESSAWFNVGMIIIMGVLALITGLEHFDNEE